MRFSEFLLFTFVSVLSAEDGSGENSIVEEDDIVTIEGEVGHSTTIQPLHKRAQEEVKKAIKGIANTTTNGVNAIGNAVENFSLPTQCTAVDCNNRGTCVGTKTAFICVCNLGFSGRSCEDSICDSNRDCNGRGLCLGTTNSLTCLCNIGFNGRRCENLVQ